MKILRDKKCQPIGPLHCVTHTEKNMKFGTNNYFSLKYILLTHTTTIQ